MKLVERYRAAPRLSYGLTYGGLGSQNGPGEPSMGLLPCAVVEEEMPEFERKPESLPISCQPPARDDDGHALPIGLGPERAYANAPVYLNNANTEAACLHHSAERFNGIGA